MLICTLLGAQYHLAGLAVATDDAGDEDDVVAQNTLK